MKAVEQYFPVVLFSCTRWVCGWNHEVWLLNESCWAVLSCGCSAVYLQYFTEWNYFLFTCRRMRLAGHLLLCSSTSLLEPMLTCWSKKLVIGHTCELHNQTKLSKLHTKTGFTVTGLQTQFFLKTWSSILDSAGEDKGPVSVKIYETLKAVCGLPPHQGKTERRKNLEQKFTFQIGTLTFTHGINNDFHSTHLFSFFTLPCFSQQRSSTVRCTYM